MKVWIFAELVLMTRQVSDPYRSTDFTFELKILSLVVVDIDFVFHTCFRWQMLGVLSLLLP